ncbi:unnamed protein product [Adineta steineri]|uniref:Prolyl 4-hydroxylase alpha subunit Fe(2+) 2OG dioxygenase domain-containing protein n=1 Tax=Adineta steineri TaxID=433720 RepID=A0A818JEV2_9BILA|nr:unnamed protein product [Adineta steineri]CAF3538285.1 unnamed protein product [Adineta steineri]
MATTTAIAMDINDNEDIVSNTDTLIYDDEDIQLLGDEINDNNWRYAFQEVLDDIHENKLDDGTRLLSYDNPCKIRVKKLGNTPYTFPLSNALCSRIICEHGIPLSLINTYDFCGTKVTNSAWEIDHSAIDFPLSFTAAIQSQAFEQLHLNTSDLNTEFYLNLDKLIMFGPCSQTKVYNFDEKLFIYLATVLVFLPSYYTGGNYRFIDDNDDSDDVHRHTFNQHESDNSKPFILIVPSDCQHEIEPIEKGFKLLLVYHLVSKTSSTHEFYSLLSKSNNNSMNIQNIFLTQRLNHIFTYWEKNLDKMPSKILIPIQHSLDYTPFFSMLFRDKYRTILQLITTTLKQLSSSSSFLIYSAILQQDEPFGNTTDSRLLINNLKLLNTTNDFILDLNIQHERTVIPNEVLGELHMYIDAYEQSGGRQQTLANGNVVYRNYSKFHVLVIIPYEYQWDLLLDDYSFACHHVSYMLSLPTNSLNILCLNLLECILRNKTLSILSFDQLIRYFIQLYNRIGLTTKLIQSLKILFQHKQFKDELFSNKILHYWLNRLVECFHSWPMFSMEFLDLFRKSISTSMPTKLNEIVQFLLQFSHKTLRTLLINTLLRHIFKRRGLPRHILLSTCCSILHLLIVDGSYSVDALLTLAYNIIKRVRKTSLANEILDKSFKMYLIPMLINIYRDIKDKEKRIHSKISLSPAFILIYEYCLNTLNYYCISTLSSSSPLNIISMNEALLICPCTSCARLQIFLIDPKNSTLIYDLSLSLTVDHCLRHTLSKFPMLSIEYKHDPCTGREQTLIISKYGYEQEQKQLCFHLRRLLLQLHQI